ncbi:Retrovirus-related Pol polyprotein from transposon TNT 1-94 [Abeliophyllum distichum]|uniref:Retrovirus-related Pol polyprotein from transposon TNT 1-94 n=1 Tax=Abeliophyllum distichum TaxID=126358 RepID=A0ABD1V6V4_9LAMI
MDSLYVMTVSKGNQNQEWILDSGCTFHMSPIRAWFKDYKEIEPRKVYMGANNTQVAVKIGNIDIRIHDGMVRTIHNVRHVPNLKRKLVALGVLEDEGYWFKAEGKSHRLSFGKGVHNSTTTLAYIHADMWGPENHLTHGGNKYFLSLVDDDSRKAWIFLLKTKDEAFRNFRSWVALVENQKESKVKVLRTDNGLEFCNLEFDSYCREKGIQRHKTVKHTLQQNRVAERLNRTIMDKVRCLLISFGLSKGFWGEAACTDVYLINISPSSAIDFKTPEEVWSGNPPNLAHLRVFGCAAFAQQVEGKLDARASKCVMLGYPTSVKGYRLWVYGEKGIKIINSRDVVFNELEMPSLKGKGKSEVRLYESQPGKLITEICHEKNNQAPLEQNHSNPQETTKITEPHQSQVDQPQDRCYRAN